MVNFKLRKHTAKIAHLQDLRPGSELSGNVNQACRSLMPQRHLIGTQWSHSVRAQAFRLHTTSKYTFQ